MSENILGEALRRERLARGLRQTELAERFGIAQPSYHRWESGENTPADERFADVAQFLGVDIGEVFRMAHQSVPPTSLKTLRDEMVAMKVVVEQNGRDLAQLTARLDSLVASLAAALRADHS